MNHLVTIVGYDDNYAKENFTRKVNGSVVEGSTPPENGAFIVKNSWGSLTDEDIRTAVKDEFGNTVYKSPNASKWGIDDTGYFYISYYDHSLRTPTSFAFYDEDETEFYELNYDQYDLMQDVKYYDLKLKEETTQAANIFTAEEDEYLYQISAMVSKPMSKIKYKIYANVNDTPDSGELIEQGEITKQYAGYQRIDLSNMTYLPKGTRYSVIITQETRDDNDAVYTPVSVGLCVNYFASDGLVVNSVINEGESFVRSGGEWVDFASMKSDVEDLFFKENTKGYVSSVIASRYPNLAGDFQVDNLPIKAFLVPARTVTEFILGDADLDDEVTVTDATMIQRFDCGMVGLSDTALAASDVDGNYDVTILDATWIQRWELKMRAPEDIGKAKLIRADD